MLGRASLALAPAARVSHRAVTVSAASSVRVRLFSYSNQNKPETKEAANEALSDAKAGKTAAEVAHHKATTGGQPLARESGAAGAKATHDNAVSHTRNTTQHNTIRGQSEVKGEELAGHITHSNSAVYSAALLVLRAY